MGGGGEDCRYIVGGGDDRSRQIDAYIANSLAPHTTHNDYTEARYIISSYHASGHDYLVLTDSADVDDAGAVPGEYLLTRPCLTVPDPDGLIVACPQRNEGWVTIQIHKRGRGGGAMPIQGGVFLGGLQRRVALWRPACHPCERGRGS